MVGNGKEPYQHKQRQSFKEKIKQ